MSIKLTYYGHSTFGIETDDAKLIVDPFFAPNNPAATVKVDEVEADFILVTHGHGDHVADLVPLAKQTGALVICNFEIANWLGNQGVENVHAMHIGGGYDLPFGRAKMTIAHHGSGLPDGSYGGNPAGFLLHLNEGADIYISGDTALTYDMRLIGEAGGVDLAILCMGDNFTMGPDDAVRAAQFVQAKHVIPCHYDTFPPIRQDADAFAKKLYDAAEIDCTVMAVGDEFTL
ncbi:MAG: metal-dependent hydrolase [Caldilineaceae bacterium]|nr:metal-dependent hydrolase [Caldilineaceae bacterium]